MRPAPTHLGRQFLEQCEIPGATLNQHQVVLPDPGALSHEPVGDGAVIDRVGPRRAVARVRCLPMRAHWGRLGGFVAAGERPDQHERWEHLRESFHTILPIRRVHPGAVVEDHHQLLEVPALMFSSARQGTRDH